MDTQKLHKAHLMRQKKRLYEQVALASQLYKNLNSELASIEEELKTMEQHPVKSIRQDQKVSVVIKDKNISKNVMKSFKETYTAQLPESASHINVYKEEFSKIRIHKMLVPPEFISQELKGKIFVPIDQLIDHYIDYNDSNTDWFTFGVLYHKQLVKNEVGKTLMVFWLTDLKGHHFRMLLDSKAFTLLQDEGIGSVLGVLNAKIYKPSQRSACAALYINNPDKYVKLGNSVDLSWCKVSGCEEILNKSLKSNLCDEHRLRKYKDALNERQEFAVGTSQFQLGPPIGSLNHKVVASINNRANYFLGPDGNLTAEGLKVKFNQPLEVTTQAASSDQLDAIVNSHSAGGALVRKAIGIEKDESEIQHAFGPNALAKMGGNPNRPKSNDSSPKASPSKRKVDEVAAIVNACKVGSLLMGKRTASPKGSPLKSKNVDLKKKQKFEESDDEFELVISSKV